MTDPKESMADKAEGLARRIFERLGSAVENKLRHSESPLSAREVSKLLPMLESAIESNLLADSKGIKRLAPNVFRISFPYEHGPVETSYSDALADELKTFAEEFLTNRRYEMRGPVQVEITTDLFAKTTTITTRSESLSQSPTDKPQSGDRVSLTLTSNLGDFKVRLVKSGAPATVGRSSEATVRVEHSSISRLHCSITYRSDGSVVIADLDSANGTSLNGSQLEPRQVRSLSNGDVISIGDIDLRVTHLATE